MDKRQGLDGVIDSTLTQNGIFTTDADGEIHITNLAPGAYVITEIKAPAGYVMDQPSTNVVIGANGDTQTVSYTHLGAVLLPFGIVAAVGVGIGAAVFFRRRSEVEEVESSEKSQ